MKGKISARKAGKQFNKRFEDCSSSVFDNGVRALREEKDALSSSAQESAESAEKSVDEALRDVFEKNADEKERDEWIYKA